MSNLSAHDFYSNLPDELIAEILQDIPLSAEILAQSIQLLRDSREELRYVLSQQDLIQIDSPRVVDSPPSVAAVDGTLAIEQTFGSDFFSSGRRCRRSGVGVSRSGSGCGGGLVGGGGEMSYGEERRWVPRRSTPEFGRGRAGDGGGRDAQIARIERDLDLTPGGLQMATISGVQEMSCSRASRQSRGKGGTATVERELEIVKQGRERR